jgi:hypothetical protein
LRERNRNDTVVSSTHSVISMFFSFVVGRFKDSVGAFWHHGTLKVQVKHPFLYGLEDRRRCHEMSWNAVSVESALSSLSILRELPRFAHSQPKMA